MNKNDWVVGRKYRFIGGESPSGFHTGFWTVGKVYEMTMEPSWYETHQDDELSPDSLFKGDDGDENYMDLCCFEPVFPFLYVVGMRRKSDGKIFLSDSPRNPYEDFEKAQSDVEHRARNNSDGYVYFVYELVPVMSAELDSPPVKKNWFK